MSIFKFKIDELSAMCLATHYFIGTAPLDEDGHIPDINYTSKLDGWPAGWLAGFRVKILTENVNILRRYSIQTYGYYHFPRNPSGTRLAKFAQSFSY